MSAKKEENKQNNNNNDKTDIISLYSASEDDNGDDNQNGEKNASKIKYNLRSLAKIGDGTNAGNGVGNGDGTNTAKNNTAGHGDTTGNNNAAISEHVCLCSCIYIYHFVSFLYCFYDVLCCVCTYYNI